MKLVVLALLLVGCAPPPYYPVIPGAYGTPAPPPRPKCAHHDRLLGCAPSPTER